MINKPFVKEYDKMGNVVNDFERSYVSEFPNRKSRREHLNKGRFQNNRKSANLTLVGRSKFRRVLQTELDKKGNVKLIEHYLEA